MGATSDWRGEREKDVKKNIFFLTSFSPCCYLDTMLDDDVFLGLLLC